MAIARPETAEARAAREKAEAEAERRARIETKRANTAAFLKLLLPPAKLLGLASLLVGSFYGALLADGNTVATVIASAGGLAASAGLLSLLPGRMEFTIKNGKIWIVATGAFGAFFGMLYFFGKLPFIGGVNSGWLIDATMRLVT